jgi:hypothetical protein
LTSGCDVTVNLKRVCDESSIVLKGIGELMGGIAKIQAELAKGKTCVEVEGNIEKMLTDGGAMLARFSKAMEPVKEKWKQHGHLLPKLKDSVNHTPKNTTNVATKSKEEMARAGHCSEAQRRRRTH